MKTKAPHPLSMGTKESLLPITKVYFEFVHLKQLYRQGWLKHNITEERCESVADHSFGVAVVAMMLADTHFPELDVRKVLRMALIHDFGEIYAGDITPDAGITLEQKNHIERESLQRVFKGFPRGKEYLLLWEEFEKGESPEARFIQQIDKLEMALQARVYEHQMLGNLSDFYISAGKSITIPELETILRELEALK